MFKGNEKEFIDIIDDQAHAMQKLCEMLREEKNKKAFIGKNISISGDYLEIDGDALIEGKTFNCGVKELRVNGVLELTGESESDKLVAKVCELAKDLVDRNKVAKSKKPKVKAKK